MFLKNIASGKIGMVFFQWQLSCVDNDIPVYISPLDIDNKNLQ